MGKYLYHHSNSRTIINNTNNNNNNKKRGRKPKRELLSARTEEKAKESLIAESYDTKYDIKNNNNNNIYFSERENCFHIPGCIAIITSCPLTYRKRCEGFHYVDDG